MILKNKNKIKLEYLCKLYLLILCVLMVDCMTNQEDSPRFTKKKKSNNCYLFI